LFQCASKSPCPRAERYSISWGPLANTRRCSMRSFACCGNARSCIVVRSVATGVRDI
jgi:hypothetical protein